MLNCRRWGRRFVVGASLAALVGAVGCDREDPVSIPVNHAPNTTIKSVRKEDGKLVVHVEATDEDRDAIKGYSFSIDGGQTFFSYGSPITVELSELSEGRHEINVSARDVRNATDSSPDKASFNVESREINNPPKTTITGVVRDMRNGYLIGFKGEDSDGRVVGYQYRVDGGSWVDIPRSPLVMMPHEWNIGSRVVEVRAIDDDKTPDPNPARTTFEIKSFREATTDSRGIASLSVSGSVIDFSTVDNASSIGVENIELESVPSGNTGRAGIMVKDPLGRYWNYATSINLSGRGKVAGDVSLEVRLDRIPSNSRPYTIYSANPLYIDATKSSLKFIGSFPLSLAVDYFKSRDSLQDAIDMMEFVDGIAGLDANLSLYVATNLNKFREAFIGSIPQTMQTIASFVGENTDMDIIYYDVREQLFLNSNIVSLKWNPKLTTLKGRVVSSDGRPISGAEISQIVNSQAVGKTFTDANGDYVLYHVRVGNSTTVVTHPDYKRIDGPNRLNEGRIVFREPEIYTMQPIRKSEVEESSEIEDKSSVTRDDLIINELVFLSHYFLNENGRIVDRGWQHWVDGRDTEITVGRLESRDIGAHLIIRSFIQFDLSGISRRSELEEAVLNLFGSFKTDYGASSGQINFMKTLSPLPEDVIFGGPIVEPSFGPFIGTISMPPNVEGWSRLNVTDIVKSWLRGEDNYGFTLRSADESREGYFMFNVGKDIPEKPHLLLKF